MTTRLNFYHPDMRESIIRTAASAGTEVHYEARVLDLKAGASPTIVADMDGRRQEFCARSLGGFEVARNPNQTYIAGILLDVMSAPADTSHSFRVFDRCLTALLVPQGHGRVLAHLCYPAASEDKLSGESTSNDSSSGR